MFTMLKSAGASVSLSAVLIVSLATQPVSTQQPNKVPGFKGIYGSGVDEHYKYGRDVGTKFSNHVAKKLEDSQQNGVLSFINPFLNTKEGQGNFSIMLKTHTKVFPDYVAELRGLAAGANVDFSQIFALNVGESLSTIASPYPLQNFRHAIEHCSEYTMWPYNAHNEDGALIDENTTHWEDVTIDGASFSGLVYGGMLASGAFAWNSHRVGFTLNWVGPYAADVYVPFTLVSLSLVPYTPQCLCVRCLVFRLLASLDACALPLCMNGHWLRK
eukprot:m.173908 g.173908  ORF g.173908 m.173908 type:complete len:272 (+) comp18312_c0_seq7:206-1021(+)